MKPVLVKFCRQFLFFGVLSLEFYSKGLSNPSNAKLFLLEELEILLVILKFTTYIYMHNYIIMYMYDY